MSVSGKVKTPGGRGVSNAVVSITDGTTTRQTTTGVLGNFRFDNVMTGATYTISVVSGRATFTPQVIQINNNITGLTFVSGQEP